MKNKLYTNFKLASYFTITCLLIFGCTRDTDNLPEARFLATSEVYIDGFPAGLAYAAFGGSDVTAFQVDEEVKYAGTSSMRFAVPDANSPQGAYAGGVYFDEVGRDLSGFDALTFWAKATKSASIDLLGFGNDLGPSTYQATISDVAVNTNWKKYYIPIPDPSKLTQEKGMFFYAEGPEDENGYTFWIDELQFEKLGTIAHAKALILEGQDQTITSETGAQLTVGGLSASFNIPTGVDQIVNLSPAYFDFVSSASNIASVNSSGIVSVVDSGQAVITAKMGELDAEGSLTINSTGAAVSPSSPAPIPTRNQDSVISMFSNVYENVPVDTWNTRWEFSTADDFDVQIDGDDVKRYTSLNFVGIEFTSQRIDATDMTHFHMDLWTADPTALPAEFKILLVDFGPDGSFDGGDDSSHEVTITSPTLETQSWVSIDLPLTQFVGLTQRANLAQLVLSGDLPNIYIDNVYFYKGEDTAVDVPDMGAPIPTSDAADVISVFSDTYTNLEGTNFNPDWGQATILSEIQVDGNNTLLLDGFNYQGFELAESIDVTGMDFLHIDYWTANSSLLNTFLISPGPVETAYSMDVPTSGWRSVDIPLNAFDPVDLADVFQFKFDGNGSIYLDNIYFFKGGGNPMTPTEPAPVPTVDMANVISVFSDAYSNVEGTNLNPDWGQATNVSEMDIQGNNTLQYAGLNYQGIELGSAQNVSTMEFLHIDFWTANSSALNAFIISTGPVETAVALEVPTSGWASIDIPLTSFNPVDLTDIIQFKFDGNGDIYLDNIYFYKEGGGNPILPTEAAPTPIVDADKVLSVFSDTYTNLEGSNLNPDWGQATIATEIDVQGNNTLQYAGLNYQGIELGASQDVSEMEFLHLDF
ncbi:MAG: hypothetical protein AAGK97_05230, partial [Bacteroidota bacterium]